VTCDDIADLIEPIAEGVLNLDSGVAAHLASCSRCSRALEEARRLEQLLRSRPAPAAPADFTSRTMGRIRRAQWRSEQMFDLGFNIALALAAAAAISGAWILLHRTGLTAIANDVVSVFGAGLRTVVDQAEPSVHLYAGATALVVAVLALWWWAERDPLL
jgi:anti-sigma factor RsiW